MKTICGLQYLRKFVLLLGSVFVLAFTSPLSSRESLTTASPDISNQLLDGFITVSGVKRFSPNPKSSGDVEITQSQLIVCGGGTSCVFTFDVVVTPEDGDCQSQVYWAWFSKNGTPIAYSDGLHSEDYHHWTAGPVTGILGDEFEVGIEWAVPVGGGAKGPGTCYADATITAKLID